MSRIFILARDYREACDIAELAELQPYQWNYPSTHNLRGHRGVPLLMTADHCWRDSRGDAMELSQNILVADCKITMVPCPPEWRESSYRLPNGWDVPKVYPMYYQFGNEPKPKVSWRHGLWNKIRMGWR